MKPHNLISVVRGNATLEALGSGVDKSFKTLKKHEIRNMQAFCEFMSAEGCSIGDFDGFFVGYTIAQIGKEIDLLRFGSEYVLNIEIKSELKEANKNQKNIRSIAKKLLLFKVPWQTN